ncbi:MAG: hypothetical protein M3250_03565 [Thermoproteota archaeon]|nr:hypothetical protein [Thermoproteota archaeon]
MADRYVYTAYVRDIVRGSSRMWVRKVYDFAIKPDATFYFRVPNDIAIERISVVALNSSIMKQGWIWIQVMTLTIAIGFFKAE